MRLGELLGTAGEELRKLSSAEADEPTIAAVDIEVRGETILESAVVRVRAGRRLCARPFKGAPPDVLSEWLADAVVLAHNGEVFDFPRLEGVGVQVPEARLDTLRLGWLAAPFAPSHALASFAEHLGVPPVGERHGALADAETLAALWPPLQERLHALPPDTRGAIRRALQHLTPVALSVALGPGPNQRWSPPPLERGLRPSGARGAHRHLHEGPTADWLLEDLAETDTVVVTDLREGRAEGSPGLGLRLLGAQVIDRECLAERLDHLGWAGALGVVLIEACDGALPLAPPSSQRELAALPTLSDEVVEIGRGPMFTDPVALAIAPPRGSLLIADPIGVLVGTAPVLAWLDPPPPALSEMPVGVWRGGREILPEERSQLAEGRPLVGAALAAERLWLVRATDTVRLVAEPFDPSAYPYPITVTGADLGARVPEIMGLWARILGAKPTCRGQALRPSARVTLVSGLPATNRPTPVGIARLGALAAVLTRTGSLVVATSTARRKALLESLTPVWSNWGHRPLLHPPDWPTHAEAARRLAEGPHLAIASPLTASRLLTPEVRLVVDRIGGLDPSEPHVARILARATEDGEDPYGAVIEPAAALRLLALLRAYPGDALVLDPVAQLPTLRSALTIAGTVEIDTILGSPAARAEHDERLRELLSAPTGPPPNARPELPAALARLLPPGRGPEEFQETLIGHALGGEDVLGVFRTGFGKSLCYQASALALAAARGQATLVISPLIALQRNQIDQLQQRRGVWEATMLNSALAPSVRAARLRGVRAGFYVLVYLAPESLFSAAIQRTLQAVEVGLVAVDEAHCISDMGHDFRPDYRALAEGLARCLALPPGIEFDAAPSRPPILALTGTASPAVQQDISAQFGAPMITHVDRAFVRPELHFTVSRLSDTSPGRHGVSADPERLARLIEILRPLPAPVIVYATTRKETEEIAASIGDALEVRCEHYHAGLERDERRRLEEAFLANEIGFLVATNAFGMGIDKDNVGGVVHWRLPASPEALYQEAGRAGRALVRREVPQQERIRCVALYRKGDLDQPLRLGRISRPTAYEVRRTWEALCALAGSQGTDKPIVVDDDLERLAGLRPHVLPSVVVAHLERAGLVRERERTVGAIELRGRQASQSAPLGREEQALLPLLSERYRLVEVAEIERAFHDAGIAWTTQSLHAAVAALERRGLVERRRAVVVRAPGGDVNGRLLRGWDAARALVAALKQDPDYTRGGTAHIRPDLLGLERREALRAIELLAGFGCVRVIATSPDGRLPRLAAGSRPLSVLTSPSRLCQGGLCDRAIAANAGILDLDAFSAQEGEASERVVEALTAAHLLGALTLDPQSWRDGRTPARVIEVLREVDVEGALRLAQESAARRRHEVDLKQLALMRYTDLPDGPGDPHQVFLERYLTESGFLEELAAGRRNRIFDGLNAEQLRAASAPGGRIIIVAGPGTGKTRTLTRRIAHRILEGRARAEGLVAVTFTTDATQEMQVRLAALGVAGVRVMTLNALGSRLIRDYFRTLRFDAPPTLATEHELIPLTRKLLAAEGADKQNPQWVLHAIARAKGDLRGPDRLSETSLPYRLDPQLVARVWPRYQDALHERGLVDFADQLFLAVRLFDDPEVAEAARSTIEEVYVDEFQDLNRAQVELISRLSNGRGLTVVGDPRQAIYEWNGARPEHLMDLAREPGSDLHELTLNYRSTDPILAAANHLMRDSGLRAVHAPAPTPGPPVGTHPCESTEGVMGQVVDLVEAHLRRGVPDEEIAVLVRQNAEVRDVEGALRRAGLRVRASDLVPLHKTTAFALADRYLDPPLVEDAGSLADAMDLLLAEPEVAEVLEDEEGARAEWSRLTTELAERDRDGIGRPREALAHVRRAEEAERGRDQPGGVVLTTMHKAKGREWDAVVIARVADRTLEGGSPEERRVVFVALTRARRHLDAVWTGATPSLLAEAGLRGKNPPPRDSGRHHVT